MNKISTTIKIYNSYADHIRVEAAERRLSIAAVTAEYVMKGIEAEKDDSNFLAGFERRISSTILAGRSDIEAVQAELDTLTVMVDIFVRLMLTHLPAPLEEDKKAIKLSVNDRYEKFINQVTNYGFENNRPLVLQRIAELLTKKIEIGE